ncbi:3-deoxy-manno-octulosonate-8-phosphatase KdsC [Nitrosospira sp. Nsp13]|uniref:3-deoxy-manno-octulosonate-8-phosphatase KdsC n=1 Tax=Nitrosospira sp. Nsp13 TaxID=1855332 RepID=UPI00088E1131|nr:3-deoxy-manno-octulosonate-8-phosphatase KdsC [Nitrosospira sp. Nsp13]SCY30197.1 3-deoxy-D-manno-octulosonate 8-phosphate phosphatase (KDO 8-P phosphatase) [Nitrosospira sp. Nsp13]
MQHILERAKKIRAVVFDVDGVLTDGSLYLTDSGEEMKAFNSHDGHGIKMLKASGINIALITGRESRCVALKAKDWGITLVYQGAKVKLPAFEALLQKLELDASACAYVGDDLIDLPVMLRCGLAICVPAAPALVKRHAHYVTCLEGGRGAVREICEMIMQAQDTLDAQLVTYLK